MQTNYSVGRDCDAWCTRCKMDLAHTIVAIAGGLPVQVKCNTCNGFHKYRMTKGQREAASAKKKAAPQRRSAPEATNRRTERARAGGGGATEVRYAQLLEGLVGQEERAYNVRDSYEPHDVLAHPTFGIGVVLEALAGNRMRVLFADSERVLISRYGQKDLSKNK